MDFGETAARRSFPLFADVRYWPLADISICGAHVRFQGQSGHGLLHAYLYLLEAQI